MECLEGRKVHYVFGAHYGEEEGVVIKDRGEQVVVAVGPEMRLKYHAKWRLLTAEYPWGEVPSAVGVYLLAEGV